ncbi:hypothetical protein PoB_004277200 [Plakobranchus ocellatus]|uniref:Uncharacterized protein n=1 Tax=Plakobranchus ocellatus TaxID=259542 RepID=A0AAV4BA19_9GAST|nr:hypothetical protein PoB_004277200 [Plakobranchus ocellatus]
MSPAKIESAGEIAKRYGLADLVRVRMMARRLALNSMARRMSTSMNDSLELLYPDLVPLESELLPSSSYYLALDQADDAGTSRPPLPAYETRLYNRRLAEMEALRLEANDRSDRLLDRYLTRSRTRAAIMDGNAQDGEEEEDDNARNNTSSSTTQATKRNKGKNNILSEPNIEEEEDAEVNDTLEDAYENNYLDLLASTYDRPVWRRASRRLLRRRLLPYAFRPLTVTSRLLARRGLYH